MSGIIIDSKTGKEYSFTATDSDKTIKELIAEREKTHAQCDLFCKTRPQELPFK